MLGLLKPDWSEDKVAEGNNGLGSGKLLSSGDGLKIGVGPGSNVRSRVIISVSKTKKNNTHLLMTIERWRPYKMACEIKK